MQGPEHVQLCAVDRMLREQQAVVDAQRAAEADAAAEAAVIAETEAIDHRLVCSRCRLMQAVQPARDCDLQTARTQAAAGTSLPGISWTLLLLRRCWRRGCSRSWPAALLTGLRSGLQTRPSGELQARASLRATPPRTHRTVRPVMLRTSVQWSGLTWTPASFLSVRLFCPVWPGSCKLRAQASPCSAQPRVCDMVVYRSAQLPRAVPQQAAVL